jgi:hypothetical protein
MNYGDSDNGGLLGFSEMHKSFIINDWTIGPAGNACEIPEEGKKSCEGLMQARRLRSGLAAKAAPLQTLEANSDPVSGSVTERNSL